jgi:hypothetical protein
VVDRDGDGFALCRALPIVALLNRTHVGRSRRFLIDLEKFGARAQPPASLVRNQRSGKCRDPHREPIARPDPTARIYLNR